MTETTVPPRPPSRIWLYAPFAVLAVLAMGWSAFWFYAVARSEETLDKIIAREAALGRRWTCQDRAISGFPFRFEARCASVALAAQRSGGELAISSGPLVILAQIYNPQLILLKAQGPTAITQPDGTKTTLRWASYDSSLYLNGLALERASTVVVSPVMETGAGEIPFKAATLEVHVRRNPVRPASDGVTDISIQARGAGLPVLDFYAGSAAPADIDLTASITRSSIFMTGLKPENFDLWQSAGGRVDISRLAIAKDTSRLDTKGELGLDEQRRLMGRLETSAAGLERIIAQLTGISVGNIGNIGGLLSGRAPIAPSGSGPQLKPLPAIELRDGRVQVGPLRIPRLQLQPLY
jgi:hypothetical protein